MPSHEANISQACTAPHTASSRKKHRIATSQIYDGEVQGLYIYTTYTILSSHKKERTGLFGGVRGDLTFVFERVPGVDDDRFVRERERDFKTGLLQDRRRK
jgi:hypothetical protein